ncbi:MAG: helix-turn-helix transcriptional regulator [Lachnospiraceae bacterium]|nr:helix-turn-helix transcriptional regulator [Lachnospiraceae bacterium]
MELKRKLHQLRKMSGLTQEQLAEKLDVSRQTISKWESGASVPDLESMVKFSRLFQISLDDLLQEEEKEVTDRKEKLTIEDFMEMNRRNRKMTVLLTGGLLFLMVGILTGIFVMTLRSTTLSMQYMLYRYIVVGEYAHAPVSYGRLLWPGIVAVLIGLGLCVWYGVENKRGKK